MKNYIYTIYLLLFLYGSMLSAQDRSNTLSKQNTNKNSMSGAGDSSTADTTKIVTPSAVTWTISPRFGERTVVPNDTVLSDFHQTSLVDGQGVGMGYLGNIGSPTMTKVFFDTAVPSRFTFLNAFRYSDKRPEDQLFMDTKVPYSNIWYQKAGGGQTSENRFKVDLASNFGKKINAGFNVDYIYARGFYQNLSNKQVNFDFFGSYTGDKYTMQADVSSNNFINTENGGIQASKYITHPDTIISFTGNSLDIPVRLNNTWNELHGKHIYITNRYDLGKDTEEYMVNDSTKAVRKKKDYTSLASIIFTSHYTDQMREMRSNDPNFDLIYTPNVNGREARLPAYDEASKDYMMLDRMSYYSFKNTFALAMNEGFRPWTKFGLTAFIESDIRRYAMPMVLGEERTFAPIIIPGVSQHFGEKVLLIGGMISKEKGKYLRFKGYAEKDLFNPDYRLEGQITTIGYLKDRPFSVKANAYAKSVLPNFFENHFASKYWIWNNHFVNTQRVFMGGEVVLPKLAFSETKISGGVENLSNYIYYGENGLPAQEKDNVQVLSLRLDQNFKMGILSWDNQIVYQATSNDKVIPLPTLALYTNIYMTTKLAKVLSLQLGVDAHYHTRYYAQGYEPLTIQFYNQREQQIGNFPIMTGYANLNLKYTRFFIMMYNLAQGVGNSGYFSLPNYPVNPKGIKFGLSWRFNN